MEFRVVGPRDEQALAALFTDVDVTFFRPHPFTPEEAHRIATLGGSDVFALLLEDDRPIAYGMLRGWDEGYASPSLGIAVRTSQQGHGYGRAMMLLLHAEAARHGSKTIRLRVHPDNTPARRLYESMGYEYHGEERGELVMTLAIARPAEAEPTPG